MVCNILKDNYSSSLKSMSKTISPLLIILNMTHIIEFVSGTTFVFVTWDVIWNLMMMTFLSNLHMARIIYIYIYIYICVCVCVCLCVCVCVYTNLWDGKVPMLMDLESSGKLGFFFSCESLLEGQNDVYCPVLFHNSTEQG
jgi:hypothetical protein